MFPEKTLGELPLLRQNLSLFQYAVYPVHCRCQPSFDAVSVFGIILYHLTCAYLVVAVYLPEDDSPVTGSTQTVFLQQPGQYFSCLAAVISGKERGKETEEVAVNALRLLHIMEWYVTYGT